MRKSSLVFVGLLAFGAASTASSECGLATLKGGYLYNDTGFVGEPSMPYAESGMTVYDGQGGIQNTYADNIDGSIRQQSGKYVVNADCTGTATYGDHSYNLFISPDGSMLTTIMKSGASKVTISGSETRVAK